MIKKLTFIAKTLLIVANVAFSSQEFNKQFKELGQKAGLSLNNIKSKKSIYFNYGGFSIENNSTPNLKLIFRRSQSVQETNLEVLLNDVPIREFSGKKISSELTEINIPLPKSYLKENFQLLQFKAIDLRPNSSDCDTNTDMLWHIHQDSNINVKLQKETKNLTINNFIYLAKNYSPVNIVAPSELTHKNMEAYVWLVAILNTQGIKSNFISSLDSDNIAENEKKLFINFNPNSKTLSKNNKAIQVANDKNEYYLDFHSKDNDFREVIKSFSELTQSKYLDVDNLELINSTNIYDQYDINKKQFSFKELGIEKLYFNGQGTKRVSYNLDLGKFPFPPKKISLNLNANHSEVTRSDSSSDFRVSFNYNLIKSKRLTSNGEFKNLVVEIPSEFYKRYNTVSFETRNLGCHINYEFELLSNSYLSIDEYESEVGPYFEHLPWFYKNKPTIYISRKSGINGIKAAAGLLYLHWITKGLNKEYLHVDYLENYDPNSKDGAIIVLNTKLLEEYKLSSILSPNNINNSFKLIRGGQLLTLSVQDNYSFLELNKTNGQPKLIASYTDNNGLKNLAEKLQELNTQKGINWLFGTVALLPENKENFITYSDKVYPKKLSINNYTIERNKFYIPHKRYWLMFLLIFGTLILLYMVKNIIRKP